MPRADFRQAAFRRLQGGSRQIRAIFARHTTIIEPLSLDEAYLDVTENPRGVASATRIAEEIRAAIRDETGLTASAGVPTTNSWQTRLRSPQARRTLRHHAEHGAGLRRYIAG